MKAEISVDYLTFTCHQYTNPDDVIVYILGMDSSLFEETHKGINFYKQSLAYNGIRVCYDGLYPDIMGISINMSGQGVRTYEDYHGTDILPLLIKIDQSGYMNASRLDIACDDRAGFLDIDTIWEYVRDGKIRTRMKSKTFYEAYKGGMTAAQTLYIGSETSMNRIRIYDKAKEAYNVKTEPELYYSQWIRFEMVFRGDYADQAIHALVRSEDIGATVAGIINSRFAFIESDDTNISRCSLASWWVEFLESMSGDTLTPKGKAKHTIDQHLAWLVNSISRVTAKVHKAIGDDKFIRMILDVGAGKLTEVDKKHIADYKEAAFNDEWAPVFGRIPRKRTFCEPPQHNVGDLWQGEPEQAMVPVFTDLPGDDGLEQLPLTPVRYVGAVG